jgi:hypothetical protein
MLLACITLVAVTAILTAELASLDREGLMFHTEAGGSRHSRQTYD